MSSVGTGHFEYMQESYPKTRILVSKTETTMSLSSRTSLIVFFTASSNSSSLFRTCAQQEGTLLLLQLPISRDEMENKMA